MAQRVLRREIELNWSIEDQGAALLNRLPNSTSVSGNLLEVANTYLENTTLISDAAEAHHQHLREMVTQSEAATRQARHHLAQHVGYQNRTQAEKDLALMQHNNQQIRTLALRVANTSIMVQHLTKLNVQQLVEGNRHLAQTIFELPANAINYPLFHTRSARCNRMCFTHCALSVTLSLQHLVTMRIFVSQRVWVGNGFEYGLAPQFAATIPEPPRFDVPEPPLRYMYDALNETSSEGSGEEEA